MLSSSDLADDLLGPTSEDLAEHFCGLDLSWFRPEPVFERAVARGELERASEGADLLEALVAPLYFRALVTRASLNDWPLEAMVDRLLGA